MSSSTSTATPKKFLNNPSEAVSEFISGLLLQYPTKLRKLANHNVILSSEIDHKKVTLLSGGGSGHEPSHAGWIGKGMLTGAILGGIFASPSVASILAAIRAVTSISASNTSDGDAESSGGGCLLIVKNYTGDRLNFGMACEMAVNEGRKVRMVIVADDTALERTKGITGARGVAGTVLVHKVAGAAAAMGMTLNQVADIAQDVANRVGTLGVALNAVTIPGATTVNQRLDSNTIEIGMGIHGEAGMRQSPLKTADELANVMVTTILEHGRISTSKGISSSGSSSNDDHTSKSVTIPSFQEGDNLAVMINNLGGTSNFEMSILANSVVKVLEGPRLKCKVSRLYVGTFMSSFDMQGASVSIISLSDAPHSYLDLLDATTDAVAWQTSDCFVGERPSSVEIPEVNAPGKDTKKVNVDVAIPNFESNLREKVKRICMKLVESEPLLTKYDTVVGDGDCGMTFERGAKQVLSSLEDRRLPTNHPVVFFESLADEISSSMGGTSGILLEICFRKMSSHLNSIRNAIDVKDIENAFEEGVKAISFYGGANVGSRTMLDALYPAVLAMKSGSNNPATVAMEGAQSTATMSNASAGRSNYLSQDTLLGTPDPGAIAVSIALSCIYNKDDI